MFTLGIATDPGSGSRSIEIIAAGVGLLVVALEIAYLPALYYAFSTRETEVTLLATRAGTPAWGPEILARHRVLDSLNELPRSTATGSVGPPRSPRATPTIPHSFGSGRRCPHAAGFWPGGRHGLGGAVPRREPEPTPRQARLCLSMGTNCLRSMAGALKIPFDPDPNPTTGTRLTKEEFADGFERLVEANSPWSGSSMMPGATSRGGASTTSRLSTA